MESKEKVYFANQKLAWEQKQHRQVADSTGVLGILEYGQDFDFPVKRAFYVTKVEADAIRGCHSHASLKQLIVCLAGSFVLSLDNGGQKASFKMQSDGSCFYVDGLVWREMREFSQDALMLVLCDREYRYDEVIRDYDSFLLNLREANL